VDDVSSQGCQDFSLRSQDQSKAACRPDVGRSAFRAVWLRVALLDVAVGGGARKCQRQQHTETDKDGDDQQRLAHAPIPPALESNIQSQTQTMLSRKHISQDSKQTASLVDHCSVRKALDSLLVDVAYTLPSRAAKQDRWRDRRRKVEGGNTETCAQV